jgi:hypothetical protein
MNSRILSLCLVLSLALAGCGIQIILPASQTPGPTQTTRIDVPMPAAGSPTTNLALTFGAGLLTLAPGSPELLGGTATYNIPDFKPTLTISGSSVQLAQGSWTLTGIPDLSQVKNEWYLALGNAPLNLKINAGACQGEYELGGLSLDNLTISDGASHVDLKFSTPNRVPMNLLEYTTGASNISLSGLANANFTTMLFESGAGNYSLDFSGTLQRDASVTIRTGLSNLALILPSDVPATVTVGGGLSNVSTGSSWTQDGSRYTQQGSGPAWSITVEMGAGNLTIHP